MRNLKHINKQNEKQKKISGGTQFFPSKFEHISTAGWISQTDEW